MPRFFKLYNKAAAGLIIACLFLLPPQVSAHPHVFVENKIEIVFDEAGLAGFQSTWVFDEMFTIVILEDMLEISDYAMMPEHVPMIKEQAFDHLKEHGYFTDITINRKPFKVQFVKDFDARLDGEKLVYEFFIPCHVKAISSWKTVNVAQYDPTFYSALTFAEDPISLTKKEQFQVEHKTEVNQDKSYYFGMLHPWETEIRFKLKE
ncbi:ABC-type uncharacterized transport system periplasmic component-like protein [Desulfatibacillum aliphaticivorans]|uniref:ABC-type uncharacterized transport system periplasmic component-like protein n=1 Tax=Desulfatibacillum aliphaticivorans TaxID=218208 RepID=B8FKQ4_DESAL|nr:DUF1007 family protein [Desulfatibacillum aliphaticivorans]ACL04426.1 ABC-type uncharacterized transport system periplasmic component-like protein [Desulfatibacillum aliphaticivorans]